VGLSDDSQRRIVRNEAIFRDANERMQEQAERHVQTGEAVPFLCECGQAGCAEIVRITPAEYEAVRSNARWFFVLPGHEIPEAERIVDRHEGHFVVEKADEAGELARESDPRS
jgi:hypothetical protein